MPQLVYILADPGGARSLLGGQIAHMRRQGFEVAVIASPGEALSDLARREGAAPIGIPIDREIHPCKDLVSLVRLYRTLRALRPEIVNAGTPKAGLLGMIAARLAGVPVRIYTLRGLRLETAGPVMRLILGLAERLASACADRVVCVSESLKQRYLGLALASARKVVVLAAGSSKGVDVTRFRPGRRRSAEVREMRVRLGIAETAPVIGFVGRFTRDKGLVELFESFQSLLPRFPDARLLLLGDFEQGDRVPPWCVRQLRTHRQVILPGQVTDTPPYYAMMDVLAFPSYREGFPNVLLEAAASEVPVVAFRVTGTIDAVEDGVTGTLVPAGDTGALCAAVCRYLESPGLRREHGRAGRRRVLRDYRQEVVWEALQEEYVRCLHEKGLRSPARAGGASAARPPGAALIPQPPGSESLSMPVQAPRHLSGPR